MVLYQVYAIGTKENVFKMLINLYYLLFYSALFTSCHKPEKSDTTILNIIKDSSASLVAMKEVDYRPAYHFTPPQKWMNDPNGLVYYKGIYHLFYQHNPASSVWGPMHWGHATSSDLFNWQDHPIALYPDELGTIFSGSAVVDSDNTSGFKSGIEDPLVAIYTSAGQKQQQSIAFSNDAGQTWQKYLQNPIIPNPGLPDFRDPKVFWHSITKKWMMVLAVGQKINIYSSINLKNWTFESSFGEGVGAHGGVWECPDLIELPVEGSSIKKWVMLVSINPGGPNGGSATQYFVGKFDGKNFIPDGREISWIDWGTDNYAGVTFSNISKSGKSILIGWMSNWNYADKVPTTIWRSTTTIPRELSLIQKEKSFILKSRPVADIETYKAGTPDTLVSKSVKVHELYDNSIIKSGSYEINFSADLSATKMVKVELGNKLEKLSIFIDKESNQIMIDRGASGQVDFNGQFKDKIIAPYSIKTGISTTFKIYVDKTSMELFVDNGELVLTTLFFPTYQYNYLKILGDEVNMSISNFSLTGLSTSIKR